MDQDQTWVDPLVGLILRTPGQHRLHARVYTEIGGFGAGSDFTWQVFPTVGFRFTDRVSLEVGYRWLDLDYATGDGQRAVRLRRADPGARRRARPPVLSGRTRPTALPVGVTGGARRLPGKR